MRSDDQKLPAARKSDLVLRQLEGELLLYDLGTDKAFRLNDTAKAIFESCDGNTTYKELRQQHPELDEKLIEYGLHQLSRRNLLTVRVSEAPSRRDVMRVAAVALPVVVGLVAPLAAQQQSCLPGGAPCSLQNAGACCSQACFNSSPTPICLPVAGECLPAGLPCSLQNAGACCSEICFNGEPTPVCGSAQGCLPPGALCDFNNAGACCSDVCADLDSNGTPTCI
jgi:hypothetical protein